MKHILTTALLFASAMALGGGLAAQNLLAFPDGSTQTTTGNFIPFGYSKLNKNYSEGRFQQLVPARLLPSNPSVIVAIDVAMLSPAGTATITYKSLKITMCTSPISVLDNVFAKNLPRPVVVFDKKDVKLTYTARQWTRIALSVPFLFDASGSIVIDIQKVVDESVQTASAPSHMTSGDPGRGDLPHPIYDFGAYGGGASTATTRRFSSFYPFKFRMLTTGPTLTIRSDPGGANQNVFALGGSLTLTTYGMAGGAFQNFASVGFAATPVPFFGGKIYLATPNLPLNGGVLGTSGTNTLTLPIPNLASLLGANIAVQGASGPAIRVTNPVDFIVNK